MLACFGHLLLILFVVLAVASEVSAQYSVGNICSRDDECSVNEYCQIRNDVYPACRMGLCACRPGFFTTKGFQCVKASIVRKYLGEYCTNDVSEAIAVQNAYCCNSEVACRPGFQQSGNQCLAKLSCLYGMRYADCLPPREYGEPCVINAECNCFVNPAYDGHAGFTNGGGFCKNGRCACNLLDNQVVQAGIFDENTVSFVNKTLCVKRSINRLNLPLQSVCTLNPAKFSYDSNTAICAPGHYCFQCPEDSLTMPQINFSYNGICRTWNQNPPSPPIYTGCKRGCNRGWRK